MRYVIRTGLAALAAGCLLAMPARSHAVHVIQCSGDITDELQEYIETSNWGDMGLACVKNPCGSYIQLTAGECEITRTIKICTKEGLRIEGEGRGATILSWNPADQDNLVGPMFSLQNASGVRFAHLGICVASGETLMSAVDMYNMCHGCTINADGSDACTDCTTDGNGDEVCDGCVVEYGGTTRNYDSVEPDADDPDADGYLYEWGQWPHSSANSIEDVAIGACRTDSRLENGVRVRMHPGVTGWTGSNCKEIPDGDCHNENHSFTTVHVSGFHDSAFVVEGRNAKGITFYDVHCDGRHDGGDTFVEDCCGYSCVRTGRVGDPDPNDVSYPRPEDYPETSGNFYWYGGSAAHLSDAVFLLGSNSDTVHISGLQAERSRALLYMRDCTYEKRAFPVIIDSVRFDTDWVDEWNDSWDPNNPSYPVASLFGKIVFFPLRGPLILRNNVFGRCDAATEPDNVSIGWTFQQDEGNSPNAMSGGFVFEGNALGSSNASPFIPIDDQGDPEIYAYDEEHRTWTYPTTQRSNLVCTASDDNTYHWTPMPQHFTEVATSKQQTISVSEVGTSHEYYLLTGNGTISNLTHGIAGQEVMLIAQGATFPPGPLLQHGQGIELHGDADWRMGKDDVLWLVLGSDGVWRELSRSTN